MKNIIKLLLVFDIILSALPVIAQKTKATKQPNIVFIISDDHRWDALGAAGNKKIKTPVLDKLARKGVYFRQAIIHVSQCAPSRATLLTGLSPHQNGYYSINYLRSDLQWADRFKVPTMPELLQQAGYQTVLVGKWHLSTNPWLTGFSDVRTWLPEGVAAYNNARLAKGNSRKKEEVKGFTNEIFANDAVAFLNSKQAKEKPFLLWFAATIPHSPYMPNPSHIEHLYDSDTAANLILPAFPHNTKVDMSGLGDTGDTAKLRNYYESVSYLDELVGRVLAALQKQGLAENTIVVFLGDNGLMVGSRGLKGKVVPYEESVRVPLIIYAPKFATVKGRTDVPVSSLDIPATLLSMVGVLYPKDWSGRDLQPVLKGNKNHNIRYAISEWVDTEGQFRHNTHRLIRTPHYKLIRWENPAKPDELYDLVADPHEMKNVAGKTPVRSVRAQLSKDLNAWMVKTNDPAILWKKTSANISGQAEQDRIEAANRSAVEDKNPVSVDPKVFDGYVGRYEFTTRMTISISKEGGQLFFSGERGKSLLIPKSESLFVHKTQPMSLSFIRNEKGEVTHLIRRISRSGEELTFDMKARKIE